MLQYVIASGCQPSKQWLIAACSALVGLAALCPLSLSLAPEHYGSPTSYSFLKYEVLLGELGLDICVEILQ
jgi:hypothetical protein